MHIDKNSESESYGVYIIFLKARCCFIKRGDIIITAAVLVAAVTLALIFSITSSKGEKVVIKENNEVIYEVSLYENKVLELDGNTVEIKNGKVDVTKADCKNRVCVKHKVIEEKGESIVCLPNKVIVEIK